MTYILMAVMAVLIIAADQITKYLTIRNIAPTISENYISFVQKIGEVFHFDTSIYSTMEKKTTFIPNFLSFSHHHNDGGAWSMFSGAIWLFIIVFALFAVFIVWEFSKKRMPFTTFERFCIVAVFAGGLGNMIDRVRLGFVIDMIETEFMDFPIFNVADIFITCGCILLIAHLVLFNKEFWKDDKKK